MCGCVHYFIPVMTPFHSINNPPAPKFCKFCHTPPFKSQKLPTGIGVPIAIPPPGLLESIYHEERLLSGDACRAAFNMAATNEGQSGTGKSIKLT